MQTFQDNQNQTWTLALTCGKTRRLRESLGLDLLNPTHYMQVLNSLTDRLAFVFLLIQPQAEKLEIDEAAFEERMYGDDVSHLASKAFLEETRDFFLRLGQKGLAALATSGIESMDLGRVRLSETIDNGDLASLLDKLTNPNQTAATTETSGSPSPN